MFKKLSLSVLLSFLFLATLLYPAYAYSPFWQLLSTNGLGTGTTNAIGNYTTTIRFFVKPTTNVVLTRLIVNVEDSAVTTYNLYGNVTITNGVYLRKFVTGASIITMTGAITNNLAWRRYCDVTITEAGSTDQLQAICPLDNITLSPSERFEVTLNDDFSGLDGHRFIVEGYRQ